MRAIDCIRKKRDGNKLNKEEIEFMVKGFAEGRIPDYQFSAFLMAIYFKGMDYEETFYMTKAMMGKILDLSDIEGKKVDKHSTGGVGDKVSLILAPLVASCGVYVPMVSGRALGHTGGTLDKLESIKGYRTDLTISEFKNVLKEVGCSIIGQTEEIAPADKKIYALRDVTATVESIPLIVSSIMSKKLSEGIDALVLDVKTGNGAFMRNYNKAKELAKAMVEVGERFGVKTTAFLTDMNQPLGCYIGNALEVWESVQVLSGENIEDLKKIVIELSAEMLSLAGWKIDDAYEELEKNLKNGKALNIWEKVVKFHGGDPKIVYKDDFLKTNIVHYIHSYEDGYLSYFDTFNIGIASCLLGAGREKKEDKIDHKVGIILHKKIGDKVTKNDKIFEIRANNEEKLKKAINILKKSFKIEKNKPLKPKLIYEKIKI